MCPIRDCWDLEKTALKTRLKLQETLPTETRKRKRTQWVLEVRGSRKKKHQRRLIGTKIQ
jgi:hypothetical protein